MSRITILGAGGWGIGLALVASRMGHTVTLWSFDEAELDRAIAAYQRRDRRFGGVKK